YCEAIRTAWVSRFANDSERKHREECRNMRTTCEPCQFSNVELVHSSHRCLRLLRNQIKSSSLKVSHRGSSVWTRLAVRNTHLPLLAKTILADPLIEVDTSGRPIRSLDLGVQPARIHRLPTLEWR